jgi:hypothetical protein
MCANDTVIVVAVVCVKQTESCASLDTLAQIGKVVPIYRCDSIQDVNEYMEDRLTRMEECQAAISVAAGGRGTSGWKQIPRVTIGREIVLCHGSGTLRSPEDLQVPNYLGGQVVWERYRWSGVHQERFRSLATTVFGEVPTRHYRVGTSISSRGVIQQLGQ